MTNIERKKVQDLLQQYTDKQDTVFEDQILNEIVEQFYMAYDNDEVCIKPEIVKTLIEMAYQRGKASVTDLL